MNCVVCDGELTRADACYSNAWEASLKQHPCCSATCSASFDPALHWLPVAPPAALSDDAAGESMTRGQRRLEQGDSPQVVARDLLLSGVPGWMVRRALLGVAAAAVASDKRTGFANRIGLLGLALSGFGVFFGERDRGLADARAVLGGSDQVDAWEDRFGLPRSS